MFRNIAIDYESNQRGTSTINYPDIIVVVTVVADEFSMKSSLRREIFTGTDKLDDEIGGGDDGRWTGRGWMGEKRARGWRDETLLGLTL